MEAVDRKYMQAHIRLNLRKKHKDSNMYMDNCILKLLSVKIKHHFLVKNNMLQVYEF